MNGDYKVDENTFKSLDHASQNWMLFSTFNEYRDACELRFKKLEKRKLFDTTVSGGSGLVGGFLAVLASKLWWLK